MSFQVKESRFSPKNLRLRTNLRHGRRKTGAGIRNQFRKWRGSRVEYVVYRIGGALPERSEPPRSFIEKRLPLPPQAQSVQHVQNVFQAVIDADNVDGIVLSLKPLACGFAAVYAIRRGIERLQSAGKRVIVWTPFLDMRSYYLATAADMIVAPRGTDFNVLGMKVEAQYFKDTLAEIGVRADFVQISPYKTAGNRFQQATMTPEERAQMEWLLDDRWDWLTQCFGDDRGMTQEKIKALIDSAPMDAEVAMQKGLIDAVGYEDDLPALIGARWEPQRKNDDETPKNHAKLVKFGEGMDDFTEKVRKPNKEGIAVIEISGMITMVPPASLLPVPIGEDQGAAESRITPALRKIEKNKDVKGVLVYVNSGGGDALASDLMWRQIERISHKKPVLVMMGDMAASGGYYVSAAAHEIMVNPMTITGSIGVIFGRMSTQGLNEKLKIGTATLKRGENVDLYSDPKPMDEETEQVFRERIESIYSQFKDIVADGRGLEKEGLDEICLGRVWTGRQALGNGLADTTGDFVDAKNALLRLCALPLDNDKTYTPVWNYQTKGGYLLPEGYPNSSELTALNEGAMEQTDIALPKPLKQMVSIYQNPLMELLDGRPLCLMPYEVE